MLILTQRTKLFRKCMSFNNSDTIFLRVASQVRDSTLKPSSFDVRFNLYEAELESGFVLLQGLRLILSWAEEQ